MWSRLRCKWRRYISTKMSCMWRRSCWNSILEAPYFLCISRILFAQFCNAFAGHNHRYCAFHNVKMEKSYMNIQSKISTYALGAITGILLVVGCGGGSSSVVNNAKAANISGVTSQLFCTAQNTYMRGVTTVVGIACQSSTSPTQQSFQDFYQITQLGWILVEMNVAVDSPTSNIYLFQK